MKRNTRKLVLLKQRKPHPVPITYHRTNLCTAQAPKSNTVTHVKRKIGPLKEI